MRKDVLGAALAAIGITLLLHPARAWAG